MLTKKAMAETIQLQLSGGRMQAGNHIDIRDVYNVIDMVGDTLIANEVLQSMRESNVAGVDSDWIKTYDNVLLRYDERRGIVYLKLPSRRVSLPKDADLRSVCWSQGDNVLWPKETPGSAWMWSQLEAGASQSNMFPWYPEGDQLYFRTMPKAFTGKKVMVRMVPAVTGLAESDPLPIPAQFTTVLMEKVSAFLRPQTAPAKMTNDQNPNTK